MTYKLDSATRVAGPIALSVLVFCAAGCRHEVAGKETHEAPIAPVTTVQRVKLENSFQVAGEFIPYQEVELHAKVAGYIRRINVDIGDRVKTGQVLATLDVPEIMAQVQGADAGVRQSQEQISRAKSDVLRAQANYEAVHSAAGRLEQASKARPGLIAQQEIDDALAKDRAAAAQVDSSKAAFSATQQQLGVSQADRQHYSSLADYSRIVAPFSGIITWRYADTGTLIQAGTSNAGSAPVVKLAEVDVLRLRLPVPESIAPYVRVGDPASVRVDAIAKTFQGKVTRSAGALDPSTRTMQVEIDAPNKDGQLTPGMYAEVTLDVAHSAESLTVPVQAIDQTSAQPFVLLVNSSNKIERKNVRVGISTPNRVEIVGGVKEGDRIVAVNLSDYQNGEAITPKQIATSTQENE
ncbi:MAG TPA: efflux RND transporter periplasmic adaptor subunit [Acidobacteriaceae bacterium]|jgi:RND family efflux transporter MFP subunit|nr:efflux RND transporter periplasmic adaptor subunit [Acidobacteriaceae bacterium]